MRKHWRVLFWMEIVIDFFFWLFGFYMLWVKGDTAYCSAYIGLSVWVSAHYRLSRWRDL